MSEATRDRLASLLLVVIMLMALAACASSPEPTLCPAPDGQLLLPPEPLPRLPDGPMSQRDAIEAWSHDIELFRIQQLSYAQLQSWGHDQCGWPSLTP